jgi:hypothetical protein
MPLLATSSPNFTRPGPHQEVSKMGATISHLGAEAWEGEDQSGVLPHHSYTPDLSPADFISLPKGERAPCWHFPDPEPLPKHFGTGHHDHHHWRGHRGLPPMTRAKQKVYLHRQWINWEIIRSKSFSKFYRSCFFHIVSFELELT